MAAKKSAVGTKQRRSLTNNPPGKCNNALEGAIWAAERGWPVVPQSRSKRMLVKRWTDVATDDIDQIHEWAKNHPGCNWATVTGRSGLAVVDIDPRNGGDDPLLASLPPTLQVKTGGGGHHRYYECAESVSLTKTDLAAGVELLVGAAAVTLPGSVHASGEPYRMVGRTRRLARLPMELLPSRNGSTPHGTDQPAAYKEAVQRLVAHAEEHRLRRPRRWTNGREGYDACCPAHDDRSPSLSVAVGESVPVVVKCHAGCTHDEVARALSMDARDFSSAPSSSAVEWSLLGVADAARIAEEPLDEVIPDLLAAGEKVVVAGPPKQLKTWLALHLSRCVACGEPVFGEELWTPRQQPVVFVQEEGARQRWARRIGSTFEDEPDALFNYSHRVRFSLADARQVERLTQQAVGVGARLIVIDPWQRVTSGIKEDQAADTGPAWDAVHQLASDTGAAVVILHHTRKDADLTMDAIRGSSRMAGEVDLIVVMRKLGAGQLEVNLDGREYVRRDDEAGNLRIIYGEPPWQMRRDGYVQSGKSVKTVKDATVEVLAAARGKPLATDGVHARVNAALKHEVSKEAVRLALNRLYKDGAVKRQQRGAQGAQWALKQTANHPVGAGGAS